LPADDADFADRLSKKICVISEICRQELNKSAHLQRKKELNAAKSTEEKTIKMQKKVYFCALLPDIILE